MVVKIKLVLKETSPVDQIHLIGPLKQYSAKNIAIQTCNCNILGLTDTVALLANEARFFRFSVSFGACSLQNEADDPPPFFCLFGKCRSLPFNVPSLKKVCAWDLLGMNVLRKELTVTYCSDIHLLQSPQW